MSRETVNSEGFTFEEWVCAAGLAKANVHYGWENEPFPWVQPYSESTTESVPDYSKNRMLVGGIIIPAFKTVRRTVTYYPKKVREAWRNGEDPTEWRH